MHGHAHTPLPGLVLAQRATQARHQVRGPPPQPPAAPTPPPKRSAHTRVNSTRGRTHVVDTHVASQAERKKSWLASSNEPLVEAGPATSGKKVSEAGPLGHGMCLSGSATTSPESALLWCLRLPPSLWCLLWLPCTGSAAGRLVSTAGSHLFPLRWRPPLVVFGCPVASCLLPYVPAAPAARWIFIRRVVRTHRKTKLRKVQPERAVAAQHT